MQRNYQCNIQLDQMGELVRITVVGLPGTVDAAAPAVAEIINGGTPFAAGGPASLNGACVCGVLPYVWISHAPLVLFPFLRAAQCSLVSTALVDLRNKLTGLGI